MNEQHSIEDQLALLTPLAPAGYALVLHLKFAGPTFLLQTYDQAWRDHYTNNGLVVSDPIIRWGYANRGVTTWAALEADDEVGVLKQAADYGLTHGLACSVGNETEFSFAGFAHQDRPFTDDESKTLCEITQRIHDLTYNLQSLSPQTADAMKSLSIHYTQAPIN